jgi:hypothetical protein
MGESKRRKESIGDEYGKEDASFLAANHENPKPRFCEVDKSRKLDRD